MAKYKVVRYFRAHPDGINSETVLSSLELQEARAYCNSPESSSQTATSADAVALTERVGDWFCGYRNDV